MKSHIPLIAIVAAVAAPAWAQDAPRDPGGRLAAMTCREFIAFAPADQMTVMLALRAQANGDPLPDEPLPIGTEAEVGGADGLGGDSGSPSAEGGAADAAGTATADAAATEGAGDVAEVEDTAAAAAGEPSPEALTAESLTEPPADPKLTAMRTSCLGGPDALAADAMRAAHADYE